MLYGVDSQNNTSGASIALLAGVGATGPDYATFARRYFDKANQSADDRIANGDVAHAYDSELLQWLRDRFGYAGSANDAIAYFTVLPPEQQGVFARLVYYNELRLSGREYNDAESLRFQSYLRGREAISTLFPSSVYSGDLIMGLGSASGVITDAGGNIDVLVPGGQTTIGAEGINAAGLITKGSGDISVYSKGSILLGLSRIITTFGGNVLAWSAEGDINAGRGAKTTVLYTPPRVSYDQYGLLALSPTVPSQGAGIATLDPIPEVPAGDVDLIAPFGTVDAGEAGIRVSGNVNIAALHVLNAANIQVKGNSSGLPTAVSVNTGALTSASNAASAVSTEAERLAERSRPQVVPQPADFVIIGSFLGFGL